MKESLHWPTQVLRASKNNLIICISLMIIEEDYHTKLVISVLKSTNICRLGLDGKL